MRTAMEGERKHCSRLPPHPAQLSVAQRANSRLPLLMNARGWDLKVKVTRPSHERQVLGDFLYLKHSDSSESHLEKSGGFSARSVFYAYFWRTFGKRIEEDLVRLIQDEGDFVKIDLLLWRA